MMKKLVLSPSQQEANQYAGGGTGAADSEEHWMQTLAKRVKARVDVQGWGITVVIVNKGSWRANSDESNRLGATEHLALHTNAGGGHGSELWYRTFSGKGKAFANALYPFISAASDKADRGVKGSLKYGELNHTKAVCVIAEYAYHDNAGEAGEIRRSINEYAEATVKGLARYYGKVYHPEDAPVVIPPTPSLPASITLKRGSRGNGVKTLQRALAIYPADGIFGAQTEALVIRFQKDAGMTPDGKVPTGVFAKMTDHPTVHRGHAPKAWTRVVQRLVGVEDDGIWGDHTDAAVKKEQRAHKLSVTGTLRPNDWSVLTKREK